MLKVELAGLAERSDVMGRRGEIEDFWVFSLVGWR